MRERGAAVAAVACAAAALAVALPSGATPAPASSGSVHTTASENRDGERLKTVPISKRPWQKARSVISLAPGMVGRIEAGDRVEAFGDLEISVCLKPNARHGGPGHPCVGKMYAFDPTVRARVVLASGAGGAAPSRTVPVTGTTTLECSQKQPDRNHHCVASIPWQGLTVRDPSRLGCKPGQCRLNLVVSASHRKAKRGHKVVVGSNDDSGRIKQGKSKLSAVVYKPGGLRPLASWGEGRSVRRQVPIAKLGGDRKDVVVHSLRLGGLRAGDQLVLDARATARIGHLPYNALVRSELILTDGARSASSLGGRAGKVADSTTRIATENGFNCTLGGSAHSDPCTIRKGGILSVRKGSAKPLYVNLVVNLGAKGMETMYRKWRPSHRARFGGGSIRAWKYRGTSSCEGCQQGPGSGATRFGPDNKPPKGSKKRKLVDALGRFGITQGVLDCATARSGLLCRWTSEGRLGSSRPYECSSKAEWTGKRWNVKVCKDALGAQLWQRLQQRGLNPTYAGACKGRRGVFVCRWYAKGEWASGERYFCRGEGAYDVGRHRWRIDACRNERDNR